MVNHVGDVALRKVVQRSTLGDNTANQLMIDLQRTFLVLSAGIIKLIIDQLTLVVRISSVDTVGEFSQLLFGIRQMNVEICIAYLIVTGLAGWFIANLIADSKRYITWGIASGILFWVLMNFVILASAKVTPTWSVGAGGFIINVIFWDSPLHLQ